MGPLQAALACVMANGDSPTTSGAGTTNDNTYQKSTVSVMCQQLLALKEMKNVYPCWSWSLVLKGESAVLFPLEAVLKGESAGAFSKLIFVMAPRQR